jgi:hypothetical protein
MGEIEGLEDCRWIHFEYSCGAYPVLNDRVVCGIDGGMLVRYILPSAC